jgi:hypothetical protein
VVVAAGSSLDQYLDAVEDSLQAKFHIVFVECRLRVWCCAPRRSAMNVESRARSFGSRNAATAAPSSGEVDVVPRAREVGGAAGVAVEQGRAGQLVGRVQSGVGQRVEQDLQPAQHVGRERHPVHRDVEQPRMDAGARDELQRMLARLSSG